MCYHIAWSEVTELTDHVPSGDEQHEPDAPSLPQTDDPDSIEAYETDEGVVFYDARNPLAWLKTTHALDLEQHA